MHLEWHRLDRDQSQAIIGKVTTERDASMFAPMTSEAQCTKLPFYRNYLLYRVTNYASLPSFSLEYLSDGENFYLLDGSPDPIYFANDRNALVLNRANVLDYLDFFFQNVSGEDGDVFLVRDPNDLPFLESLEPEHQAMIMDNHSPIKIDYDPSTEHITVDTTLYYGGTLLQARLGIDHDGRIQLLDQHMLTQSHTPQNVMQSGQADGTNTA